jgi:hypothetical protein
VASESGEAAPRPHLSASHLAALGRPCGVQAPTWDPGLRGRRTHQRDHPLALVSGRGPGPLRETADPAVLADYPPPIARACPRRSSSPVAIKGAGGLRVWPADLKERSRREHRPHMSRSSRSSTRIASANRIVDHLDIPRPRTMAIGEPADIAGRRTMRDGRWASSSRTESQDPQPSNSRRKASSTESRESTPRVWSSGSRIRHHVHACPGVQSGRDGGTRSSSMASSRIGIGEIRALARPTTAFAWSPTTSTCPLRAAAT